MANDSLDGMPDAVPHSSIPYSVDFTYALMRLLDDPSSNSTKPGITVVNKPSASVALPAESSVVTRLDSIDNAKLPQLQASDLPIALNDSRRVFAGPLPGINLTHPGGWIEGGAGPYAPQRSEPGITAQVHDPNEDDDDVRLHVQHLIMQHNLRTPAQVQKYLKQEVQKQVEQLKSRMEERKSALDTNERLDREIQQLESQRAIERKVEDRLRRSSGK